MDAASGARGRLSRLIVARLRLRAHPGREITRPSGVRARGCST
jgi:hypothetical protein